MNVKQENKKSQRYDMELTKNSLSKLHSGYVIEREEKFRIRINTPLKSQKCCGCLNDLKGIKSLVSQRGNGPRVYECFDCYLDRKVGGCLGCGDCIDDTIDQNHLS